MPVSRAPPPVLRTRGALKRQYESSIAPGGESAAFEEATACLAALRANLRALRARRVDLARRSSEHARKLADWKGKVPRSLGVGAVLPELDVGGCVMPCVRIAKVALATRAVRGRGRVALFFRKEFARALEGVDRFSKVWVFVRVGDQDCGRDGRVNCGGLRMVLVDVVERRGGRAVDKDILIVSDGRERFDEDAKDGDEMDDEEEDVGEETGISELGTLIGCDVIDIKPYLSYCESLPSS